MVWVCDNCSGVHCFVHDSHSDTYICTRCGFCYESGLQPPDNGEQSAASALVNTRSFKGSYRRGAHITERLKSAILQDPVVPEDVMDLIKQEWEHTQTKNYFAKLRAAQKLLRKSDIRQILRSLDKRFKDLRQVPFFERIIKLNPKSTLNFSTVFLERWKSIAAELTQSSLPVYSPHQAIKVGSMLIKLSSVWDYWQPPSRRADGSFRQVWKFTERKHIPNLNFLFQRVHELLGPEYTVFNSEFPIPTNPQALRRLWRYWREMAKAVNVPLRGMDRGQGFKEPVFKQLTLKNFIKKNEQQPISL